MSINQSSITRALDYGASASTVAKALARPTTNATPKTSNAQETNAVSGRDGTSITADDFLTLLVAEMKNQDPTQPTDPNAYISQMVGVNSLQQLIGINQGITTLDTALGSGTTTTSA